MEEKKCLIIIMVQEIFHEVSIVKLIIIFVYFIIIVNLPMIPYYANMICIIELEYLIILIINVNFDNETHNCYSMSLFNTIN